MPYPDGAYGECITPEDGYRTCDEYCAAVEGTACIDQVDGLEPPVDHECRAPLPYTPSSFTPTVIWEVDTECLVERGGRRGFPDLRNQPCDVFLFEELRGYDFVATSARCCCES